MDDTALIQVKLPPDEKDRVFSFPGKVKRSGEEVDGIVTYKIFRMNKDELKNLCKDLSLQYSGNKTMLQDRLKEYSQKPDMWNAIKPGARRSLRGPRNSGSTKTQPKGSEKRRLALKANTETEKSEHGVARTKQQERELLEWATQYVEDHPEIHEPRVKVTPSAPKLSADQHSLCEKLDGISKTLSVLVTSQTTVLPPMIIPTPASAPSVVIEPWAEPNDVTVPAILPYQPIPVLPTTHFPSSTVLPTSYPNAGSTTTPPPTTTAAGLNYVDDNVKRLTLARGVVVKYRLSEVADPRMLAFTAGDIERLARQWSDDHPRFDPSDCEVVIEGHGIALKYWPEIFGIKPRGSPDRRWTSLKGRHNEWKFVAEAYQSFNNPDGFWAKFKDSSRSDGRMTFSQITDKLRSERGKRRKPST